MKDPQYDVYLTYSKSKMIDNPKEHHEGESELKESSKTAVS
jgi:hypothetical protein